MTTIEQKRLVGRTEKGVPVYRVVVGQMDTSKRRKVEIDRRGVKRVTVTEPTLAELAHNFAEATSEWVKAGLPVVSEETHKARRAVCEGCELWDGKARFGLGKCNHKNCGCTKLKHWLATSACPLGKWKSVETP